MKEKYFPLKSRKSKKKSIVFRFFGRSKYFLKSVISWIDFNFSLLKILERFKINTCYSVFVGGIWSWHLLKIKGINHIHSYNDSTASSISKKILDFLSSEYWVIMNATMVDFLSQQVALNLGEKIGYINRANILYTPNSFINYSEFFPVFPKNELITFCSRITGIKNPGLLLEACYTLKLRGIENFKLSIIGDGDLVEDLKQFVEQKKMKNIVFHGGIDNPQDILNRSKIFISIQSTNNYPSQSLIEAMACENAIIASDVGETRRLVTENEGILVPLNPDRIAEAIQFLLEHPEKCERMGKSARQKVLKEHTIEKFTDYFLSITG
jgi:glycosyltransferase involved in cell wall biosynthesis